MNSCFYTGTHCLSVYQHVQYFFIILFTHKLIEFTTLVLLNMHTVINYTLLWITGTGLCDWFGFFAVSQCINEGGWWFKLHYGGSFEPLLYYYDFFSVPLCFLNFSLSSPLIIQLYLDVHNFLNFYMCVI